MMHSTRTFPRADLLALGLGLVLTTSACAPPEHAPLEDARLPSDVAAALAVFPSVQVRSLGFGGLPHFVTGEFGAQEDGLLAAAQAYAPALRFSPEMLVLERQWEDALGFSHARYHLFEGARPVVGAEVTVHANAQGTIYAISGAGRGDLPTGEASVSVAEARETADRWSAGHPAELEPELLYAMGSRSGRAHLAWKVGLEGGPRRGPEGGLLEWIYIDAQSGEWVRAEPLIHGAKARYVADASSSYPGTLQRSEGESPVADTGINEAYDWLGVTYDYYFSKYGRDSYNGSGGNLLSSVHYAGAYQNAFWDAAWNRMVFGDGDGTLIADMTKALDVTVHEMTHGITQYTANLVYQDEPGALNEAWSDILGAACEADHLGGVSTRTWKMGEDVLTPGNPGDALRYMNNPTLDGQSYDYYPTRYTGSQDDGGVHLNSGIANLAFYLMVAGGSHPRGQTSVTVPPMGMTSAEQIFYRALSTYLSSNAQFQDARAATAQAAADLFGQTEIDIVHAGWDAVGVPNGSSGATAQPLQNGVPETGLAETTGNGSLWYLDVPGTATALTVSTSGGSGDADLYLRYAAAPTTAVYDHVSGNNDNNESITPPAPTPGRWYVLVHAYGTFSGLDLVATYQDSTLVAPDYPTLPPPTPTP